MGVDVGFIDLETDEYVRDVAALADQVAESVAGGGNEPDELVASGLLDIDLTELGGPAYALTALRVLARSGIRTLLVSRLIGRELARLASTVLAEEYQIGVAVQPELALMPNPIGGTPLSGFFVLAEGGWQMVEGREAAVEVIPWLHGETLVYARYSNAGAKAITGPSASHLGRVSELAMSAEMLGLCEGALERTVSYLLTREQFGRPLARFQVLQHRLVDIHVALRPVSALFEYAVNRLRAGMLSAEVWSALAAETVDLGLNTMWLMRNSL
jgi:hypothetical protein